MVLPIQIYTYQRIFTFHSQIQGEPLAQVRLTQQSSLVMAMREFIKCITSVMHQFYIFDGRVMELLTHTQQMFPTRSTKRVFTQTIILILP